jgi:hypothetical protein
VNGNFTAFYRDALRYLGCIDIQTELNAEERLVYAFDLSLAALLSDEIYNFGELVCVLLQVPSGCVVIANVLILCLHCPDRTSDPGHAQGHGQGMAAQACLLLQLGRHQRLREPAASVAHAGMPAQRLQVTLPWPS